MPFLFEKLRAYQKAKSLSLVLTALSRQFPRGYSALSDQLRRAALSMPINLAEGSGRKHCADRCQFFWVSRGSVLECASVIDMATEEKIISGEERARFMSDLHLLSRMITRLIESEQRKRQTA